MRPSPPCSGLVQGHSLAVTITAQRMYMHLRPLMLTVWEAVHLKQHCKGPAVEAVRLVNVQRDALTGCMPCALQVAQCRGV